MRQIFSFFAKSTTSVKIFFLVWFFAVLAEGNCGYGYSHFEVLQNLTDSGRRNALEAGNKIQTTSREFDEYIKERLSCLMWEGSVQRQNLNKSMIEAVNKGMSKDKQFTNFQCVSNTARDTLKKLDEMQAQTPINSQKIYEKGLSEITQFKITFVGFLDYIQELYKIKEKQLEEAKDEGAREKILEEVTKKIKLLNSLLDRMISEAKAAKFKFIEEYSEFTLTTENNFKRTQSEGAKKMMKCVA